MRTVHTYTSAQQQQQQQSSTSAASSSSSSSSSSSATTNQQNLHQHSSMSGYPSVRHSLFRMHSQLRSAPNRREATQGPIDLSLYRTPQPTVAKMTTRSTSTTSTTTIRPVPIITSLVTTPTHTIFSNAMPSSTSAHTATSLYSHEQKIKLQKSFSSDVVTKRSCSPTRASSPKLAYSYSNIEENLQCALCIDRLRDPRALPCQHVFCCSCLKSIPSSNLPYPTISCPLCRRTFPYKGAEQFPVSYIHRQLLELVPKNYEVNGKCTKCQEKSSLVLCSCCDFLLCQKCFQNDREKVLDNIKHIVQTCRFRVSRIHTTHHQINELKESNRKKIQQAENIYENFQRKFFEHKQSTLDCLNRYNERISESFWSKLNLSTRNPTEEITDLLKRADSLLEKSQTTQFDDILSLFYNLNSVNEQLEHANALIDTCDVQNLLKQTIQFNPGNDSDEQISVRLNQIEDGEKIMPLIPSTILPRSIKRLRKTEPKRHVEEIDEDEEVDDDESQEDEDSNDNHEHLPILKRMKVEYQNDFNFDHFSSSPNSILCLNLPAYEQQQQTSDDDGDIIYVKTIQPISPTIPFDELFQMIETNQ